MYFQLSGCYINIKYFPFTLGMVTIGSVFYVKYFIHGDVSPTHFHDSSMKCYREIYVTFHYVQMA